MMNQKLSGKQWKVKKVPRRYAGFFRGMGWKVAKDNHKKKYLVMGKAF